MKPVTSGENKPASLEMTSMIDVVFLLLIFFIVTLQIPPDEGSLQAAVPKAKKESAQVTAPEEDPEKDFEDIKVMVRYKEITREFLISCDNQRQYTFEMLQGKLQAKYQYNPDARVIIDCGDQVPYYGMVKALNAAQGASFRKISFANIR